VKSSQPTARACTTHVAATFRSADNATSLNAGLRTGWRRKAHRLEADRYVGELAYSITLATEQRRSHFASSENVEWCLEELERAAPLKDFEIHAYIFMPDHLHLLVAGTSYSASLPVFVKAFKQRTAYWFKQRHGQTLWQKSYYDHVVRREEDIQVVTEYFAANPLRAGLAEDWQAYTHWGGPMLEALAEKN
jgi:putative transposase